MSENHYGRQGDFALGRNAPERVIAVDIETVSLANPTIEFDASKVKLGNRKDPEKVKAFLAEARASFNEDNALYHDFARVAAIGFCSIALNNGQPYILVAKTEEEEKVILSEFCKTVIGQTKLAVFNGLEFDLPFIVGRMRHLGMAERHELTYNVLKQKTTDVYKELNCWIYGDRGTLRSGYGGLEKQAEAYGLSSDYRPEGCSSAQCGKFLISGDEEKQEAGKAHLLADVEETLALYYRL